MALAATYNGRLQPPQPILAADLESFRASFSASIGGAGATSASTHASCASISLQHLVPFKSVELQTIDPVEHDFTKDFGEQWDSTWAPPPFLTVCIGRADAASASVIAAFPFRLAD